MPASDSQRALADPDPTRHGGDAATVSLGADEAERIARRAAPGSVDITAAVAPPAKRASRAPRIAAAAVVLVVGGAVAWMGLRDDSPDDAPSRTLAIAAEPTDASTSRTDAGPAMSVGPTAPGRVGFAVSRPRPLSGLASDWAQLPVPLRERTIRFVAEPGGHVAVVPPDTPDDAVAAMARALHGGASPRAFDLRLGLRPELMHTTVRLNLRARPTVEDHAIFRVLPHDAVVVALYGDVDGTPSAREGDEAMSHVVVAPESAGWVRSRFLAPLGGCLPTAQAVEDDLLEDFGGDGGDLLDVEGVPEHEMPWARADRMIATGVTAKTHAYLDGRRQPIFLFAAADVVLGDSLIVAYRLAPDCAIERIRGHYVSGVLDESFLTETLPNGGRTLLVVSHAPSSTHAADGLLEWSATPLDGYRPVWTDQLRTSVGLPDHLQAGVAGTRDRIALRRRAPFALSVREPGEPRRWLVWEDGALVPEADEEVAETAAEGRIDTP